MPNPDILIRTGGHQRLSNFMLWQLAYAELFFLKKLWPDFNKRDLLKIINKYKKSIRNFELYDFKKFQNRTMTSLLLFVLIYLMFNYDIV